MTMRKKDYEAIARAIKTAPVVRTNNFCMPANMRDRREAIHDAAHLIADYCATQDPTFKRERFLADCGVSYD